MERDTMLATARIVLRVFLAFNVAAAAGLVIALILSFPFAGVVLHLLSAKYGARTDPAAVLAAMRVLLAGGAVAGVVLHRLFAALLAIVATVRTGDPFTLDNATRLRTIGWALLAMQLLDLAQGALTAWFARLHVDQVGWSPALGGWIAVLMMFVLARVFRIGAQMRDDLAMTV